MRKLADMTLDEGLDLVVAVREKRAAGPNLAGIMSMLQGIPSSIAGAIQPNPANEEAQKALVNSIRNALSRGAVGAAAGGLAGGLSSMNQPKGRRTPISRALTGALIGGVGGGGGSLLADTIRSPEVQTSLPGSSPPESPASNTIEQLTNPPPTTSIRDMVRKLFDTGHRRGQVPDIPGLPTVRRNALNAQQQSDGSLNWSPATDPAGADISVPVVPENAEPNPNVDLMRSGPVEFARHVAAGPQGPNGETSPWAIPQTVGSAVGGAAAGTAAGHGVSRLPVPRPFGYSPTGAIQALQTDATANEALKGMPLGDQHQKDIAALYNGLRQGGMSDQAAAKAILAQGAAAGRTPEIDNLLNQIASSEAALNTPNAPPAANPLDELLNPANQRPQPDRALAQQTLDAAKQRLPQVDPANMRDVASRNTLSPQITKDVAKRIRGAQRIGGGKFLRPAGGLAGLVGAPVLSRMLFNSFGSQLTDAAAAAKIKQLTEAGLRPEQFQQAPRAGVPQSNWMYP